MLITAVEQYTKGKFKIYLDGQFAFVLYKGELRRFDIDVGNELQEEDYLEIMNEIILKRAKRRTLYLLKDMSRTEQQIRNKLNEGCYPKDIIEKAIDYAKSFNYINDELYARNYVEYKSVSKSRRAIVSELSQKGVSKEIIERIYAKAEPNEEEAIIKAIEKRRIDLNSADKTQMNKLYMFLNRKGFRYDDIERAVRKMKGQDQF